MFEGRPSRLKLEPGDVFAERWRIERALAEGGMGTVYEAAHVETDAPCAVKLMRPELIASAELRARFRREAVVTARIHSDHIVQVFDAGTASGVPYLVMERLVGVDLETTAQRLGPVPPYLVVELLQQVAHALHRSHAEAVVHRDLKPSNLMLTQRDDGQVCVKVLDFGIAKIVAQSRAQTTLTVGSPLYMAPEQIEGDRRIGPATDRYALGQLAYRLLVGEEYYRPVQEQHQPKTFPLLDAILRGTAVEPASQRAARRGRSLPPGFDPWFSHATAVDPAARYEDAYTQIAALADALSVARPQFAARWW